MTAPLGIALDRAAKVPLATQIHAAVADAIRTGQLAGGARLPSWRDLAAQLGVARGTVREAYERLGDEQLIVGRGAAGTYVVERIASAPVDRPAEPSASPTLFHDFEAVPLAFQMGVPAHDAFPVKLWSRIMVRSARAAAAAPTSYPDPRGNPDLRREIAAMLAIARGIRCTPAQVLVTAGFAGALGLVLRTLRLEGATAWLEDPAFPLTRRALVQAGVATIPVPVDAHGIDVAEGVRRAPKAAFALVTPGQHAPFGMTLSLERRLALLEWARAAGAWIVEDDYMSELQLKGRAAPALASLDTAGRVLHAGSFSKTISPALRLGFLVVPEALAARFGEVAASLAPAPAGTTQRAVAAFLAEGHYLRHLRRMKRLYAARRDIVLGALQTAISEAGAEATIRAQASGGFSARLDLADGADDVDIAIRALPFGMAPVALSPWYADPPRPKGLLLGITNLSQHRLGSDAARLVALVRAGGG